jgi:RNA polymerase sigma factor (sigma-70 family)
MAGESQGAILRGIGRIFNHGSLTGLSEGQLLCLFAAGDEGAFEVLVSRHGPMVLGVCRRLLDDSRDAEDAFQATFLVLLKKAGGLRDPEAVGPWLYGVAYRVAARIRARAARRPLEERNGARPHAVPPDCEPEQNELRALIDAEILRLPEKYRRPVVLCYVEGRSHEEAARRLRCSTGSLRGRLDRAREKLKARLIRRGVVPAVGLAALSAGGEVASAAVPVPMVAATVATLVRAATATAVSGIASATVLEVANSVFLSMFVAKVRLAAWLVAGILTLGALPLVVALEPLGPKRASRQDSSRPADERNQGPPAQGIAVSGSVIDEEGRPIAGARVARGSDLRGQANVREATTDADGRFVIGGIPAGALVLTAQAPGHAPDLKTMTAEPGLAPAEFWLESGHTIRGRIVDAHDKPIAGAPVAADQWRGHHSLRWSTRTDAEGRFRWDDAPADVVLIDLGELGFKGKRFYRAVPDAPEWTVPMRRPLRVRGRVTDAETGRPVKPFTLVPGHAFNNTDQAGWDNDETQEIPGLSYDVLLSTTSPLRLVRIEADGYLPAVSRPMEDDEEEVVLHFALKRGSGVEGIVRGLDRVPIAGAEVLLATPSRMGFLNDGRPQPHGSRIVQTRASGLFSFEPQEPPYTIVVLHDRGYAWQEVKARPKAPAELTIRPWGRVEGTLRLGGRPAGGQQLTLYREPTPYLPQSTHWNGYAMTDAEGRFHFDRIVPGEVQVSRLIPFGATSYGGGSPSAGMDIAPGATARLSLGGTGRPIVGKAVVPAEFAERRDWTFGPCYLRRKPTEADLKVPVPFRRPVESYVFAVDPDGSFRLEGIGAGAYQITILVNKRTEGESDVEGENLASVRREVAVPEIPGGWSDEPLDLGKIPLSVWNAPAAAPGETRP